MREITIDQFAVVNILFQFYSFDYFLESAAKIGFRKIDLWTGYPHMLLDNDYEKQCGEIRKKCEDMGLQIANVMPKVIGWPLNIADEDDKIRNRAVDYLKRAIDAAEILGAPSLQLVPGTGLYVRRIPYGIYPEGNVRGSARSDRSDRGVREGCHAAHEGCADQQLVLTIFLAIINQEEGVRYTLSSFL